MNNEIVFYSTPNGDKKVEVLFQDENFWLTQKDIARLFGVEIPAISKHLGNIYETGELERKSTLSILETTAADGKIYKTKYYNSDIHHRRLIRLKGYDYSHTGVYFVTICTQNRECLFGEILDKKMMLNDAGRVIQTVWDEIPSHYSGIEIDAFAIMPNHIHGIINIVGAGPRACPDDGVQPSQTGQPQGVAPTKDEPWLT